MSKYFANALVSYTRVGQLKRYLGRVQIMDNGWIKLHGEDDLHLPPDAVHYVEPHADEDE